MTVIKTLRALGLREDDADIEYTCLGVITGHLGKSELGSYA
ncbi:MAG: hypothetical protein ACXAAQ_11910 [Candidatus Thorarchaeota archaeon]